MQTMSAVGRKATLAGIPERSRAGWAALPFSLSPTEPWTAGPSLPPGAERTQAFSEVGLGVSVGLRVCMWQTQRQPCWDCAVWTARAQHHPGGPVFTVSLGCKACPLHTASLFPWLLQGELMWGPAKGTSTRWGARPEHCLPRMGPAVPCPRTPGLGTPPRGHTDVSRNVSVLGGPRSYTPCPGLPVTVRLCATAWPRPTSSRPPGVTHSPLASLIPHWPGLP